MPKCSSKAELMKKYERIDMFGQTINLTYKGSPVFRNYIGTNLTLIMYFVVGIYAVVEFIPVFTNEV
jgi:hypothetical protein